MPQYVFILGRTPLLSIAELHSFFSETQIKEIQKEFLIVELDSSLKDQDKLQDSLGGTIKICEIVRILEDKEKLEPEINNLLQKHFLLAKTKVAFGISAYNLAKDSKKILKKLLKNSKKILKSAGIRSRFVNKNCAKLTSVQIKKENLIGEKGLEINIIQGSRIYLAKTITVQNFENYSKRDYEKPCRDPKSGMLPPKVAQIMINLGKPAQTIIDPFCGTGTILMEALLMGYNAVGSDISLEAVKASAKNIEWLKENFEVNRKSKITQQDAVKLEITEKNFAVVTEPYLGPPLTFPPSEEKISKIQKELKDLYLKFLKNLKNHIKSHTNIIIIFPYIKVKNKKYFLGIAPEVEKLGFLSQDLISKTTQNKFALKLTNHKSLLYERKDQIVGREIWRFTKT